MSPALLLQMALLLILGQSVLGALGFVSMGVPWLGLPLTGAMFWIYARIARVLRHDLAQATRKGALIVPERLAFFVAVFAQVPGFALLPYWAPGWATNVWQGALLPVAGTLDLFWPVVLTAVQPWLWVASLLEIVLFTWLVIRPDPATTRYTPPQPARRAVSGEWAPARRRVDRSRRPPRDEEKE